MSAAAGRRDLLLPPLARLRRRRGPPGSSRFTPEKGESYRDARARIEDEFERRPSRWLLAEHHGNNADAPRPGAAQMDRKHLGVLAKKHRLQATTTEPPWAGPSASDADASAPDVDASAPDVGAIRPRRSTPVRHREQYDACRPATSTHPPPSSPRPRLRRHRVLRPAADASVPDVDASASVVTASASVVNASASVVNASVSVVTASVSPTSLTRPSPVPPFPSCRLPVLSLSRKRRRPRRARPTASGRGPSPTAPASCSGRRWSPPR